MHNVIAVTNDAIQGRILAYLTTQVWGAEFGDFRRCAELRDLHDLELGCALRSLEADRRIRKRTIPVRFRPGDKYLRRDVDVWTLAEGGGA